MHVILELMSMFQVGICQSKIDYYTQLFSFFAAPIARLIVLLTL